MTRVSIRWCTLAGVMAGLLGLTAAQASAASGGTGWTVVTPPASTTGAQLTGSFALSDTDAWAVGGPASANAAPVALNWNGTTWSAVPTPTPSGSTPNWTFASVAASGANDAWAVGEQSSGTKIHDSLFEHWNGTAWSVVAGPNEGLVRAVLDFSPTNAWAFADFSVLHWNGTAWSVVPGALPALAVSADGPNDIWGVSRDNIVTHFNGTSWSSFTLPGPSGTDFESVTALSPTDVWVGGTNGTGPLIEHFNGTSWHVMRTPSSFAGAGVFAITARSDSNVWIFSVHNPLTEAVLIAHWNGSSWTTSPSPIPADSLVSIGSAASSPSHVWLFGTDFTTGEPMILSHS
jgi:hypothetical protein